MSIASATRSGVESHPGIGSQLESFTADGDGLGVVATELHDDGVRAHLGKLLGDVGRPVEVVGAAQTADEAEVDGGIDHTGIGAPIDERRAEQLDERVADDPQIERSRDA